MGDHRIMKALARNPRQDHRLAFFRSFLKSPKQVGSVIPSSRFLEKRIVKSAEVARARLVVELGPGTGGTTRALLRTMRPDAKLLAIEINPRFTSLLRRTVKDPRLIVHRGSASEIAPALAKYELDAPDVILSGIPFSTMTRAEGIAVLQAVKNSLAPDGRFVAYQFRDRVEDLGRSVFGRAHKTTELLNVPPMRVYRWSKPAVTVHPRSHRA
jgi:phospholipid N-methyltransferase